MRIILWIGKESNQKALANKIHEKFPLTAIVIEEKKTRKKITIGKLVGKVAEKIFLGKIGKAWFGMLDFYSRRFPLYPEVATLTVENINTTEVYEFTRKSQPDLIMVSGTRLIKDCLLSIAPPIGIMNLHTGISPYIKGGPNCTNWCIATKQFHLIGNTIMWIDKGIDTGNLMATEFTDFTGDESLLDVHIKVMEHAHSLCVRSIEQLSRNQLNNVPQSSLGRGVTYFNRQWGLKEKLKLLRNFAHFKRAVSTGDTIKRKVGVVTVPLQKDAS